MAALCLCKGVSHTATKNKVVHLVHEVLDDANLGGHLRTAHDCGEGALDVAEHVVHGLHFLLHEVAEHLVVGIEVVGDNGGRGVLAVCRTKRVVHVYVGIGSQSLGKFLLAGFHCLLSLFVSGVGLLDANGLAFFFGIEAKVFEQEHFAGLEGGSCFGCFGAVGSKLNGNAEVCAHRFYDLRERELGVHLSFGLAHVAHDDECAAVGKDFLKRGQCAANAGVVGHVTVLIEGYVEVNANNGLEAFEIACVDCHNAYILILCISFSAQNYEKR